MKLNIQQAKFGHRNCNKRKLCECITLQFLFEQVAANIWGILPHCKQCRPWEGFKVVVKQSWREYGYELAPVRGEYNYSLFCNLRLNIWIFYFYNQLTFYLYNCLRVSVTKNGQFNFFVLLPNIFYGYPTKYSACMKQSRTYSSFFFLFLFFLFQITGFNVGPTVIKYAMQIMSCLIDVTLTELPSFIVVVLFS